MNMQPDRYYKPVHCKAVSRLPLAWPLVLAVVLPLPHGRTPLRGAGHRHRSEAGSTLKATGSGEGRGHFPAQPLPWLLPVCKCADICCSGKRGYSAEAGRSIQGKGRIIHLFVSYSVFLMFSKAYHLADSVNKLNITNKQKTALVKDIFKPHEMQCQLGFSFLAF